MKKAYVLSIALLLLVGCDESPDPGPLQPDAGPGFDGPVPTYHEDVAPLIARECLSCHVEGGIGPFELDSYAEVERHGEVVAEAVMIGYMPPWLPDRECRQYAHERGLSTEEREVFDHWVAGGMPEGDPADAPPPPVDETPVLEATHVARMAEPYMPDASVPDDYRCFILDHVFEADSFLVGRNVIPGQSALVHHVLTYAVPPDAFGEIEAADAADDGPGYTCFGGPVPDAGGEGNGGSLSLIGMGGWVPGAVPVIAREGQGVYIPAGSRVVMQVHYNLLASEPAPDSTELHMAITTEEPEHLVTTFPTAILDLNIRAGAPETVHTSTFRNWRSEPMTIVGFTPHMHLLGTRIALERVPAGGSDPDACLIDVPRWDFNWQQSYGVREGEEITLMPGEGLRLTCEYDNSVSNQPVVNGEQVEPRDVEWGEGTLDEMCLLYVAEQTEWTGEPPPLGCEAADDCLAACEATDAECLLSCEGLAAGCRICTMESTLGCARDTCLGAYAPAASCFDTCLTSWAIMGGSFVSCMRADCDAAWPGIAECVQGVIDAGTCDAQMTECGLPAR